MWLTIYGNTGSICDDQVFDSVLEALRSRGTIELDEEIYEDAAALSGVSKFSARVKCAMLAWVALEESLAQTS